MMKKYGWILCVMVSLSTTPVLAGEYTVTPAPKPWGPGETGVVPGVPGPTLPIIPGKVVAQGYHRPLTKDERDAQKLLTKAAHLAHTKPPKFGSQCVVPQVEIQSGVDDPDYVIETDDHCAVRINIWTQHAIGDDDPVVPPPDVLPPGVVLPPGFPTAKPPATSSVTPQSPMVSYSAR
jgi:hypothetical protein